MHDRRDANRTEMRSVTRSSQYSKSANEHANSFARGHLECPMRSRTVALDGRTAVVGGKECRGVFEERAPG